MANLFKKIDKFLFNQMDTVKTHPEYLKVMEKLSSLDDQLKVIINQSISFFIIFAPVILVLVLFFQNSSLKAHKEAKFDILSLSRYIIDQNQELERANSQLSTISAIGDQDAFNASFQSALRTEGVDASKFKVDDFEVLKTGSRIQKIESFVSFTNINLRTFTDTLKALEKRLKARFKEFEVTRSKKGDTLSGNFSLLVVGKSNGN